MLVVAGPAGSGKSNAFPVAELASQLGIRAFNIDDRCAELNAGRYQQIPPEIRARAQAECERFVESCIASRIGFTTETTLRSRAAIEQAKRASATGFVTRMFYVATADVALTVERIRRRGLGGGHSAPAATIREIHAASLANLPAALHAFNEVSIFDNTGAGPVLVAESSNSVLVHHLSPEWLRRALDGTEFAVR